MSTRLILPCLGLLVLAACADGSPTRQPDPDPAPVGPALSDELVAGRFDFPDEPFGPGNRAPIDIFLRKGDLAVDFTLLDLDGNEVSLSGLLATKPVMLMTGSWSCPVYQEILEDINLLASSVGKTGNRLSEDVHFVHVYVVEAHPQAPDVSPNYGAVLESQYSTGPNPRNYPDRRVEAERMAERLGAGQLMLVDDIRPRPYDNPIFSTYGSGANCAFLIDQDGLIREAQIWADAAVMGSSIRRLLRTLED